MMILAFLDPILEDHLRFLGGRFLGIAGRIAQEFWRG